MQPAERARTMTRHAGSVFALFGLAIVCALPNAAWAQAWPAGPITIIVPFVPGGTTDIIAREIGQKLSERLGKQVVIDNRGGAGGTLGAGIAARAAPDGYTLFMATIAHTIAPGLYRNGLPYNFERDFAPITVVASVPNILLVNPAVPAKSEKELIAYLKANPGKVSFGSAGNGSVEHLSGELFRFMTGTDIVHVPYKGGAPMLADLMSGQIQMSIETSGSAAPFVRSGKVRALAVSTAKRSAAFPDLPTMAEAGVPGYEVTTWYGLVAPVGTPADIINKIRDQVVAALQTPEIRKRLDDIGAEPGGMAPAQFAAFIASETAKWGKVIKDSGATID
jgi:tripartite-type tricarboxylate transporter receptor subunit TctC